MKISLAFFPIFIFLGCGDQKEGQSSKKPEKEIPAVQVQDYCHEVYVNLAAGGGLYWGTVADVKLENVFANAETGTFVLRVGKNLAGKSEKELELPFHWWDLNAGLAKGDEIQKLEPWGMSGNWPGRPKIGTDVDIT